MTRFECPRCQYVFVAETSGDQAFADCPQCASLALPTGEEDPAAAASSFSSDDIGHTDEHQTMTSAENFQPPAAAQRPGIFNELVGSETGDAFDTSPSIPHPAKPATKMPSTLFAAPPSLEGAPVNDAGMSPFTIEAEEPEEEDLYRAATEAYTPPSALGADAPWAGLPTPSTDGAPVGGPSIDSATGLPTLTPLTPEAAAPPAPTPMATEVDERPPGLDAGTDLPSSDGASAFATSAETAAPSSEESVFSNPGGEAIRPSLTIEDGMTPAAETREQLDAVTSESGAPAGLIVDPGLLGDVPDPPSSAAASFGGSAAASFGDIENDATDLMTPAAASLEQINASQEGAALDDGNAAALFAGANFDDLEAAFDEAADRPGHETQELARAEDALRQTSDADVLYERPPEDDVDAGLNVPSAPSAPATPSLTLKKQAAVPHLSLSQSTIEATALPLHGGSFVSEPSGANVAADGMPARTRNPALDEPTLVTRDREATDPTRRRPRKNPDVVVPSLWAGITPLRVGAVLFFACVLGTVLGGLIAPGKTDRPITKRVRAEDQFAQGNKAYEAGKLDDALGYFRGAIARDNTFGLGHRAMGTVLAKQNRGEDAAKAYRTYLELTPGAVDYGQVIDIIKRFDPKMLPKRDGQKGDRGKSKTDSDKASEDGREAKAPSGGDSQAVAAAPSGEH